jgi:hypothetical protein
VAAAATGAPHRRQQRGRPRLAAAGGRPSRVAGGAGRGGASHARAGAAQHSSCVHHDGRGVCLAQHGQRLEGWLYSRAVRAKDRMWSSAATAPPGTNAPVSGVGVQPTAPQHPCRRRNTQQTPKAFFFGALTCASTQHPLPSRQTPTMQSRTSAGQHCPPRRTKTHQTAQPDSSHITGQPQSEHHTDPQPQACTKNLGWRANARSAPPRCHAHGFMHAPSCSDLCQKRRLAGTRATEAASPQQSTWPSTSSKAQSLPTHT